MVRVVFEFKDSYTHGKFVCRQGTYESLDKCIEMNGLGKDCEYRIISVEEIK